MSSGNQDGGSAGPQDGATLSTDAGTPPGARDGPTAELSAGDRADPLYAIASGLYVAALVAPLLVLGLARVRDDTVILYVGFLLAVVGCTGLVAFAVGRRPGLAVRLGRHETVWLLVVLPWTWILGVGAATGGGFDPSGLAVLLTVVGTGCGAFVGLALVVMSRTRHANAVLATTTERVEWEARWPRSWRRAATAVLVVTFGVAGIGMVAALALGRSWGWVLYYPLILGTPFMNFLNPRTVRATDAGLLVDQRVYRLHRPWSTYRGYELTADALTLEPAAWWRLAPRFDREDIDDLDAVVDTLDAKMQ